MAFIDALVFPSMELDAPMRTAKRPPVDRGDLRRYFRVLDAARNFVITALRRTQESFSVVRRSTFGARPDPRVAPPIAECDEEEARHQVRMKEERDEARRLASLSGGDPFSPRRGTAQAKTATV